MWRPIPRLSVSMRKLGERTVLPGSYLASNPRFRRFFRDLAIMSSSKKYRQFLAGPITGKQVKELPGIGKVAAKRMIFHKSADRVLGMFLRVERNESEFCRWLMSESGLNSKNQKKCYDALKEYCNLHL